MRKTYEVKPEILSHVHAYVQRKEYGLVSYWSAARAQRSVNESPAIFKRTSRIMNSSSKYMNLNPVLIKLFKQMMIPFINIIEYLEKILL